MNALNHSVLVKMPYLSNDEKNQALWMVRCGRNLRQIVRAIKCSRIVLTSSTILLPPSQSWYEFFRGSCKPSQNQEIVQLSQQHFLNVGKVQFSIKLTKMSQQPAVLLQVKLFKVFSHFPAQKYCL